ncbi:MAG: hypothetical protein Tp131SUR933471_37 [Prokaryotic dsDNA virus sp.]|nr:MAG: hypothetical protein Tp131SUR933471_37 [Prokaryotic dsDNA virus sp.]|tara:strand:- start:22649 stop:24211 length:1563 start_codon:yes stop_codon:yes gene_type:complete
MANRIEYTLLVNDAGKVKVEGITKSFVKLETAINQVSTNLKKQRDEFTKLNTTLPNTVSNAGLAGATLTELGRTISDLPFGIRGVANNLSQLSTLFITLVAKSDDGGKSLGGVRSAFQLLFNQLKGPLGIILAFQSVIALLDALANNKLPFFKDKVDEAAESTRDFALSARSVREELRALELAESLNEQALGIEKQLAQLDIALEKQEGTRRNIRKQFENIQKLRREEASIAGEEQLPISLALVDAEIALNGTIKDTLEAKNDESLNDAERLNLAKQLISSEDARNKLLIRRDKILAKLAKANKRDLIEGVGRPGAEEGLIFSNEFIEKTKTGTQLYAESILQGYEKVELGAKKHTRSMEEINFALALIDGQRLDVFASATDALAVLFGERTAAGKAFAIATATIDAYAAGNAVLKDPAFIGQPFLRTAAMISVIATGLANVKNILAVDESGGSASPTSAPTGEAQPPTFNVVGASDISQLGRTIATQRNEPVQAVVMESQVTNAQQVAARKAKNASVFS